MRRFRKVVSVVVEGSINGNTVDFTVRPAEGGVEISTVCINGSGDCRRIYMYVDQGKVGGVTVESSDKVDVVSISTSIDIHVHAK